MIRINLLPHIEHHPKPEHPWRLKNRRRTYGPPAVDILRKMWIKSYPISDGRER